MNQPTCSLPNCGRPCHPGFQYCGLAHGQIHQQTQRHSMQEQAPSWQGLTKLSSEEYKGIEWLFEKQWKKGTAPIIRSICKIDSLGANYSLHRDNARQHGNVQLLFHGTNQTCSIGETNILCSGNNCNTCSIIRTGWKKEHFGSTTGLWGRFGKAIYFTSCSSKANDYNAQTECALDGCRSMFVSQVTVGRTHYTAVNTPDARLAPFGFHSVTGDPSIHRGLNYPEVAVYDDYDAIPMYLIVYYHNTKHNISCDCSQEQLQSEVRTHMNPSVDHFLDCSIWSVFLTVFQVMIVFVVVIVSLGGGFDSNSV